LALSCPSCSFSNEPGEKFCGGCGTSLLTASTPRFGAPESYTPKHLAERIINSRAALEGERKQVTVLFADLKGSMELLADRDPEEARKILDPVLELMMEAVHRYEGTVNQVMGDGIMALFGAPLAHEDHAVRACYAALRLQERVKHYAEEVHRAHGVPIQVRVGVNSGEVIVRSIGSDLHMDYTAVGQTTHFAARLEQMAVPGSVLISTETLRLAEGHVVVNALGPRPIKGLDAPVDVYELAAAATVRSRFQVVAARGLTRFVGREAELAQLAQALDQAGGGQGQIVAVVGEAGVGKSRLYWEFTQRHRAAGWRVIESSSVSYGRATNYLPVADLLRAYFEIQAGDDTGKIREKVARKLGSLDRHLASSLLPLLWLLDVPVDDPGWQQLDPPQRRQQVLDGVKRLLLRESQVQPLIVVFEDLHWIDAETQTLLDGLVDSLPTARVLLLVNYRPEYQHSWSGKTSYRQIRIDPLSPPSADELLEALLGDDADLDPLKPLLIERTEGNPFFLEESVRTLVETRLLTGERGAYRAGRTATVLEGARQIPASAQALLAARIDRLSPERKRLLQAAAVVGTDVPVVLLQAIADEPEAALRQGLTELQAAEFLYETRLFPEPEYTFKHALTHEVAYGSLLHERRQALHARVVEAIEAAYAERLSEQVERLSDHAVRGKQWSKAMTYLRQAGAKAYGRSASREAVAYFEQALAALQHLPDTIEMRERAVDARFDLRNALFLLADIEGGLKYLREAEHLASALDDQRRLAQASSFICNSVWMLGDSLEAQSLGQRALLIAESLDDFPLAIGAMYYLGQALMTLGDYRQAEKLGRRCLALVGDRDRESFGLGRFPAVIMRAWLAWTLGECGRFAEAATFGSEAVQLGEEIGQPFSLAWAFWGLANSYAIQGNYEEALRLTERVAAVSTTAGLGIWTTFVAWGRGHLYTRLGRPEDGVLLLRQAFTTREARGLRCWNPLIAVQLGEAYASAGRREEAAEAAARALALARDRSERGHEAYAVHLLGRLAARRDPPEVEMAEGHYGEALALADGLGMRPLVAHCHLGLGKLYWRTGKREKAQEHLTTATTMYREMGMTYWLEKAEAETAGLA
jgi:class 3 adenylate cyclase/tetratricopeptide (TPR) repeat protein